MSFIWPPMLVSVLLVPLGAWLYRQIGRARRARLVRAFGGAALDSGLAPKRRRGGAVPAVLIAGGLVLLGIALGRPEAVVALPRQQGTVILAFDVSDSMAATDISPTRIAAARTAAKEFVSNQPSGISIGVVAFSDSGASVQTPTTDPAVIDAAIDRLTPKKGTSVASGINASLDAIAAAARGPYGNDYYTNATDAPSPAPTPTPVPPGYHAPAVIVLLSDGENNENPDPAAAAQAAANAGIRIFTVGIGSPDGADLDVNGVHVHTTLDSAALQQIAEMTGGTYYAAADAAQLHSVYDHLDTQLTATPELTELTSVFAGASLLLLFSGGLLSSFGLGRLP